MSTLSVAALIGQLTALALMLVVVVVVVRFLLAATHLMNRKAEVLEREVDQGQGKTANPGQ